MPKIKVVYEVGDLIFENKEDAVIYGILGYPTSFVFTDSIKKDMIRCIVKELQFIKDLYKNNPEVKDITKTREYRDKILEEKNTTVILKPSEAVERFKKNGLIDVKENEVIGPLTEDGEDLFDRLTISTSAEELKERLKKKVSENLDLLMASLV